MTGMASFETIDAAAEARVGSRGALHRRLPTPKAAAELRAVPDDRYLSLMSLRVFRASLKHSLVDAKWPVFEEVFEGFDPRRVRAMSDEALEMLMADRRVIRHWGKIRSVRHNAAALCEIAEQHGGFGAWLAGWPGERIVELWDALAARCSQMGGSSGPMFLRMAGKDSFVLSPDVVRALNHWGAFAGEPKGKRNRGQVQAAFNRWAEESGLPLSQISMTLALSVD